MHQNTSPMDTNPKFPEHEHLKCPRCDSSNTKFCYYNNYNLSQPRHFCKNCRRYWTKGGTLRNIPIGGGTRKITKRPSNSTKRTSTPTAPPPPEQTPPPTTVPAPPKPEPEQSVVFRSGVGGGGDGGGGGGGGGYAMGPFGNLLMEGLNFNLVSKSDDDVLIRNPIGDDFRSNLLRLNDANDQSDVGENRWPDLSIFTPGQICKLPNISTRK